MKMKILVIGAGYAGLFTALRLRLQGCEVKIIDQGLIGSGPSGKNHGILHSGALYSILHPEVVSDMIEAQHAYSALFSSARLDTGPSVYISSRDKASIYKDAWSVTGIGYNPFDIRQLEGVLNLEHVAEFEAYEVPLESTYSNYEMLQLLTSYCLDVGVEIEIETKIDSVLIKDGSAIGVAIYGRGEEYADKVVVSAGLGTTKLIEADELKIHETIKSRIDMMVAFKPKSQLLNRNIMVSEFGGPTMAPARGGYALAATYGCPQPAIEHYRNIPVPYAVANNQAEQLGRFLSKDYFDSDSLVMYMCTKTEYADPLLKDAWGVSPGHKVLNMQSQANISNLWLVTPGKMTLAMRASSELVADILQIEEKTIISLPFSVENYTLNEKVTSYVAAVPWI